MQRDSVLNLRLPKDVKAALKRVATTHDFGLAGGSMSKVAVALLREGLIGRGYLAAPEEWKAAAGRKTSGKATGARARR